MRVKISFDMVKDVFGYLDKSKCDELSYPQFRELSEENLRKVDIVEFAIASFNTKRHEKEIHTKCSDHHKDEGSHLKSIDANSTI